MANNQWDIGLGLSLKKNEISKIQKQIEAFSKNHAVTLKIDTSDIQKQLDGIKKQIESLSNIKINLSSGSVGASTAQSGNVKIGSTTNVYNATEAYKDLMNIMNQIKNNKVALEGLDIKTHPEKIRVLKEQLQSLNTEAEKLRTTWSAQFTLVQSNSLSRASGNSDRRFDQSSAQSIDTANAKANLETTRANVEAYKTLLNLQNQISSKKIAIAKLDTNKNENQVGELTAQLNNLESTYATLKQRLSSKLNLGQLQELDNISKQTATDINTITAKLLDIEIAQSNSAGISTLQTQLQSLVTIVREMGSIQIRIKGLENSGGNTNQIAELNSQLQTLETTYNTIYSDFSAKDGFNTLGGSNFEKLQSVFDSTRNKLQELDAAYQDARANMAVGIQTDITNGSLSTKIVKLQSDFNALGIEEQNVTNNISTLYSLLQQMEGNDNIESVIADYERFKEVLSATQNLVKRSSIVITAQRNQNKADSNAIQLGADKNSFNQEIELWLKRNSAAAKNFERQIRDVQSQIQNADKAKLDTLRSQFKLISNEAKIAGENALTFGDRLKAQISKLSVYFSGIMLITKAIQTTKNAINTVIDLDTALVDLKKTTTASNEELRKFYFEANNIGKSLGTTTKDVVQAAADWSRLGYSLKDAQEMAKTSSIFASISPGVDINTATDGLVSAMKAYKIEASDALDEVASKINAVGNSQALNNSDIIEFLTRSSSAMAVANNSLDETIALGTAITEVTRDAANAGQVMKTTSMRLRGYDEETNELSSDVQVLVGKIADLTKTAEHPVGISLFADEAKTQYKSTVEILREISNIWDELTDKQQAKILEALGGKRGGQALAAAIENFDVVESSLTTMQNSAGNAMQEMSVIEESLEFKLNKLKETGTGIAQNVFSQKTIGNWITGFTKILELIQSLTKSVGGLGTAFTALMAYKGFTSQNYDSGLGLSGIVSGVNGIKNFFTQRQLSQFSIDSGLNQDSINRLIQYNTLISQGVTRTNAYAQTMNGANEATRKMAVQVSNGSIQLDQLTTASKAAQLGMNLLNAAMNIGVSMLISLAIKGITDLVNAQQNAYDKAKEQAENAKQELENQKTEYRQLNDLIAKYKELREADPLNTVETRKQILDVQADIADLVGVEAGRIDLVNGKLKEQLEILQEISEKEYGDVVNKAEDAYIKATEEVNKFAISQDNGGRGKDIINLPDYQSSLNTANGLEILNKVLESYGVGEVRNSNGMTVQLSNLHFNENSSWTQRLEAINKAIEDLRSSPEFNTDSDLYIQLLEMQQEISKVVDKQTQSAQTYLSTLAEAYSQKNTKGVDSVKDFADARNKIIEQITNDDSVQRAILDGTLNKSDINKSVDSYLSSLNTVSDYYDNWVKQFATSSDYEKAKDLLSLKDVEETFDFSDYKDKIKDITQNFSKLSTAYNKLKSDDKKDKMSGDELLTLFEDFPTLSKYANDSDELAKQIQKLANQNVTPLIKELETLGQTIKDPEQQKQIQGLIFSLKKMSAIKIDKISLTPSDYLKHEEKQVDNIISKLEKEKDTQNAILDNLKSQKEELETIISNYEKTADAVGKYIDRTQIEPLENKKSEIEERYNTEIEKLKKENEERDRNIELQEKQDALANARKTKVRVYNETQGWTYEEDVEAVKKAKDELQTFKNEITTNTLEKQRDEEIKGIEEQIEAWEKYKDEWQKQVDAITEADEELIASKVLGVNWHEKVSNKDIGIMNDYGSRYASYNNRLKNQVEVEIQNTERAIKAREKEIDKWKQRKSDISNLNDEISDSNDKYLAKFNVFVDDESLTWEKRLAKIKSNVEKLKRLNEEANGISSSSSESGVYVVENNGEPIGFFNSQAEAENAKRRLAEEIAKKKAGSSKLPTSALESMTQGIANSLTVRKYATGGINNTTGLAWLDGTNSNSEVIFNSSQAKKLYDLVSKENFANEIKNNILSQFKNSALSNTNKSQSNINNAISISFPNAHINATDYDSFKGFMDRYTNDLLLKMHVGL